MSQQIEELEVGIKQFKGAVETLEALNRLHGNKDFQTIIGTGYFVDKASEVVLAKADPAMQTVEMQQSCDRTIVAIGELRQYFAAVTQLGQVAKRDLEAHQEALEELLQEDAA